MSRRWAIGLLSAVLLGGLALRCYRLGEASLWFDEAVSFTSIHDFSWSEMIRRTGEAVHPPLYYVCLRLWCACFGTSEAAMRGMSVALALLTILGTYLFCRDAFANSENAEQDGCLQSRGIGLLAAALVSVSSVHIVWAQQARMYMLGTALAVLSSWMLVRSLRDQASAAWSCAYALTAAAFMYSHNYALFSVLAQGCFAVGYLTWRRGQGSADASRARVLWRIGLGLAGAAALYLPWLPTLLQQSGQVQQDYWIHPLHFWTVPNAWCDLFYPRNVARPPHSLGSAAVALAMIAVLAIHVRKGEPARWLVLLMVFLPVLCATGVSLTFAPIVIPRYFLFSHVFFLCALAECVWKLPSQPRLVTAAGLLTLSLAVHGRYWEELNVAQRPGLKGAVAYVLSRKTTEEPIVVVHPAIFHAAKYYTRGLGSTKLYVASDLSHFNGRPLLTPADCIDASGLERLPGDRVWVLDSTGFRTSFVRFSLPDDWRLVPRSTASFAEVRYFQDEVIATAYRKRPPGPQAAMEEER
jgi:hypothetical protein